MVILINQNETETEKTLMNKLSCACHVQPCFQSAAVVQTEEMNDEMIAFGMPKRAKIFVLSLSMLP